MAISSSKLTLGAVLLLVLCLVGEALAPGLRPRDDGKKEGAYGHDISTRWSLARSKSSGSRKLIQEPDGVPYCALGRRVCTEPTGPPPCPPIPVVPCSGPPRHG